MRKNGKLPEILKGQIIAGDAVELTVIDNLPIVPSEVTPVNPNQVPNQVGEEVNPKGKLEIGAKIAEWNKRPSKEEVIAKTGGELAELKTGKVLDQNVQEAR